MRHTMRHLPAAALVLALAMLAAGPAAAQYEFPRVGLSAAADSWVDSLSVDADEIFTLYACVFAHEPGQALEQPLSEVSWVVHQVCCGASMDILAMDLNPDFVHTGDSPLYGMVATADSCHTAESIRLATLTVRINAPFDGPFLWSAGPYNLVRDCEGGDPIFMGMPITINVSGVTDNEDTPWGALKALYR